ncbi:hypothetical protein D3C77_531740 [compost metagenome]
MQRFKDDKLWNDQNDRRDHHCSEHNHEQRIFKGKTKPGKRISHHRARDQRAAHGQYCDDDTVQRILTEWAQLPNLGVVAPLDGVREPFGRNRCILSVRFKRVKQCGQKWQDHHERADNNDGVARAFSNPVQLHTGASFRHAALLIIHNAPTFSEE